MLVANVLNKLILAESLLAPDFPSFKRQESIFVVLNLGVLAGLLLIHTVFSSVLGSPPPLLFIVLAAGFLINTIELIWLQGAQVLSARWIVVITWCTITLNIGLAFTLASLSYRQDIQYFALLAVPVLQAAFRLSFTATMSVVAANALLDWFWVWNYFRVHPPSDVNEYIEAGTISLIYAMVGFVVWTLVAHVRSKEADLKKSLAETERAREELLVEEKLAAVGRLSSAIAHEIRNPVAMISSALTLAFRSGDDAAQRREMFEIAAKEAARLEKLTTDFLAYARPRPPARASGDVADSIAYVADICRPLARERDISVHAEAPAGLRAHIDAGQVQQALLNLLRNAIEASAPGGTVLVRGTRDNGLIRVEIENANGPIPQDVADRVFEPFFTTKASGSGLGLAIARNIARTHDGELGLTDNQAGSVRFAITLPVWTESGSTRE